MALSSEPCKAKSHVENRMQGTPRLRDPTAFTITLGEQNACISTETPSSLQDIAVTESITTDETSCLLELPTNNSYDSQLHCEPSSNTDPKKKKHKNHPPARHQRAHQSMSPWTAQSWPRSTTRAPPPQITNPCGKIHVRTVAIYREPHHRRIHRNLHVRFGFRETDHLPNRHREMYELGNKVSVVCGQIKVEEYLPGIRYSV